MRARYAVLALAGALVAPTTAHAGRALCGVTTTTFGAPTIGTLAVVQTPVVQVCVNGQLQTFTQFLFNGKQFVLPTTKVTLGTNQLGEEAYYTIGGTFDPDPSAIFTFGSVLPAGFGAFSFDASFSTPVVPGAYTNASSSGTLGVTATNASGGVTSGVVTNGVGYPPAYISGWVPFFPGTNLGVDTGSGTCSVSTPPSPNSVSCDPPGASNSFAPISPLFLTAHLSYTHTTVGTAGASSVGWTGAVDLTATTVPEPAPLGMLLGGVVLLGAVVANRRRVL